MVAGGCGGGDDAAAQLGGDDAAAIPDGVGEVLEQVVGNGVDIDIGDDGAVGMSMGEGSAQMGTDLPVPDWVPAGFPLPDDLAISLTGTDGDVRQLSGTSASPAGPSSRRIVEWFQAEGYEILQDDQDGESSFLTAVSPGGDVLDVDLGDGWLMLEVSQRDVTFDRQEAAELLESAGTAIVTLGDDRFEIDGQCRIQGKDYSFEQFAGDSGVTVTAQVFAVTEPAQGSAFVMWASGNSVEQYTINFPGGVGDTEVTTEATGYSIAGQFFSTIGSETRMGSITVMCGS
jgi:hypothetical protein